MDHNNHLIRRIDISTSLVSTLAGTGGVGSADGLGTTASFYGPSSVAMNAEGTFALIVSGGEGVEGVVRSASCRYLNGGEERSYLLRDLRLRLPFFAIIRVEAEGGCTRI